MLTDNNTEVIELFVVLSPKYPVVFPTKVLISKLPPEDVDLSAAPGANDDLKQVFSKDRVLTLPPHRPYDYSVNLLPGASLKTRKLYNLSKPEEAAIETYIWESLAAGFIPPLSSPVNAGFFIRKEDKTLQPCIDSEV